MNDSKFVREKKDKKDRIDSWKDISAYLDRGLRTVQRWHADYELPVHRILGSKGAVFAYRSEIDAWLRTRSADDVRGSFEEALTDSVDQSRSDELTALALRLRRQLSVENSDRIAQLLRQAIDLNPSNAEAYAQLSSLLIISMATGDMPYSVGYPRAKSAIDRAVELDPNSPSVISSMALYKLICERDYEGSRSAYLLLPKMKYTFGSLLGRAQLKVVEQELSTAAGFLLEAIGIDPLNGPLVSTLVWVRHLEEKYAEVVLLADAYRSGGDTISVLPFFEAFAALKIGKKDRSIAVLESALVRYPGHPLLLGMKGYCLAANGDSAAAAAILRDLMSVNFGQSTRTPYPIAILQVALGNRQQAVFWLKKSHEERVWTSLAFHLDPILDPLRGYPGFDSLIAAIGYPVPRVQNWSAAKAIEFGKSALPCAGPFCAACMARCEYPRPIMA